MSAAGLAEIPSRHAQRATLKMGDFMYIRELVNWKSPLILYPVSHQPYTHAAYPCIVPAFSTRHVLSLQDILAQPSSGTTLPCVTWECSEMELQL